MASSVAQRFEGEQEKLGTQANVCRTTGGRIGCKMHSLSPPDASR